MIISASIDHKKDYTPGPFEHVEVLAFNTIGLSTGEVKTFAICFSQGEIKTVSTDKLRVTDIDRSTHNTGEPVNSLSTHNTAVG